MSPTTAPTLVPTPVATIATPSAPRVFEALANGGFETVTPLDGWLVSGGVGSTMRPGLDGLGQAALLISNGDSTAWLHQTVRVTPGAWYTGRASMKLLGEANAAWMRVAWYASADGEGAQIAVADSNLIIAADTVASVQLGAVQAPSSALSARVRLMVRPSGREFAALMADNVQFERSAAPAPTPAATPRVLPTPGAAPRASEPGLAPTPVVNTSAPSVAPEDARLAAPPSAPTPREPARGAIAAPTQAPALRPAPAPRPGGIPMLRITEVMSDAVEAGNDADFEWIEITNLGREPAALTGLLLADNQGTIELPSLVLAQGGVLLVAGAQAKVPEGVAWWPAGGFSNGLGNAGDRIALFLESGQIIDALSYGSDTIYDRPALPAPAAGKSLARRFADDGSFLRAEVVSSPTPGTVVDTEQRGDAESSSLGGEKLDAGLNSAGWVALSLIGVGAVGAAAVQRYRVARGQ